MTHREFLEQLELYRDGEITPENAQKLADEIRSNPEFAAAVRADMRISGRLAQAMDPRDGMAMARSLRERCRGKSESDRMLAALHRKRDKNTRKRIRWIAGLVGAAALVLLAAGLFLLSKGDDSFSAGTMTHQAQPDQVPAPEHGPSIDGQIPEETAIPDELQNRTLAPAGHVLFADGFEDIAAWKRPGSPNVVPARFSADKEIKNQGRAAMKIRCVPKPDIHMGGCWRNMRVDGAISRIEFMLYKEQFPSDGTISLQLCLDNDWDQTGAFYHLPDTVRKAPLNTWVKVSFDLVRDSIAPVDPAISARITAVGLYFANGPMTVYFDDLKFMGQPSEPIESGKDIF